ncbi:MAG: hypothetical protein IJT65_06185 [Eubacterium sp.]|nr:hypothetical protein [Eubacterium sp.]
MNRMISDKYKAEEEKDLLKGKKTKKSDLSKKSQIALCVFGIIIIAVIILILLFL